MYQCPTGEMAYNKLWSKQNQIIIYYIIERSRIGSFPSRIAPTPITIFRCYQINGSHFINNNNSKMNWMALCIYVLFCIPTQEDPSTRESLQSTLYTMWNGSRNRCTYPVNTRSRKTFRCSSCQRGSTSGTLRNEMAGHGFETLLMDL